MLQTRDVGPLEIHESFNLNDYIQDVRLLGAPEADRMQLIGLLAATCEKVLHMISLICFKGKKEIFNWNFI